MCRNDLSEITKIDNTAFDMMWRNSRSSIEKALDLSAYATVAEVLKEVVGYQISTANSAGGHLARLAVLPSIQGRGIGFALVQDLLSQFNRWGAMRVTVNTQRDNFSSLSVYNKAGFQLKKETYPVYHIDL
jgi:ribosomal protein S18 acetylase RimI-like enzyme